MLLALLVAVGALVAVAPRFRVPYPILLVVGGLALGFVPGIPHVQLAPDLVLIAFLPPLIYIAAYFTSLRDLRANVRPIALLSIGLVVMTTVGVAVVAHEIAGLAWAPAFVLGAAVSATDPAAATAIARRTGLPRRIIVVVEGESLVNDGTALVAYRFAVTAVVTGTFSMGDVGLTFVKSVVGGIAVGLAVGAVMRIVRRDLHDPQAEITMSFITGYLAFLPAYALGVSGVLAVVDGRRVPGVVRARADHAGRPAPEHRRLGHDHVPSERGPVRTRRPAAATDPRLPEPRLECAPRRRRGWPCRWP